ncbi:hypothetical protein ACFXPW_03235 [Streptomyces goshikiensis]
MKRLVRDKAPDAALLVAVTVTVTVAVCVIRITEQEREGLNPGGVPGP